MIIRPIIWTVMNALNIPKTQCYCSGLGLFGTDVEMCRTCWSKQYCEHDWRYAYEGIYEGGDVNKEFSKICAKCETKVYMSNEDFRNER